MKIIRKLKIILPGALLVLLATLAGCSDQVDEGDIRAIKNFITPEPNRLAGGQPSKKQFAALVKEGVRHVVSLRPADELDWDQQSYLESMSVDYHVLPVAGIEDINRDNADRLKLILETAEGQPVFIHCASGNRVGALMAYAKHTVQDSDVESSIAHGKKWGMTGLEPALRKKLLQL